MLAPLGIWLRLQAQFLLVAEFLFGFGGFFEGFVEGGGGGGAFDAEAVHEFADWRGKVGKRQKDFNAEKRGEMRRRRAGSRRRKAGRKISGRKMGKRGSEGGTAA